MHRRPCRFFGAVYRSLYEKFGRFLPDSRDYEWAQKLFVMDSTTISLFSNVLKGAGRNPKIGKNLVSLLRHSLGYYYDLVPFLENPERVAARSFVGGHSPPGQLQLNLV